MSFPNQRVVLGVIVRRSCMGKKLSFADIQSQDDNSLVKISFQRHCWKEAESPTPFPIKNSDLPYGGLAEVRLQETETEVWNVQTWTLLEDPQETAKINAMVGDTELGGVSYSKYLKERGTQFATMTTKGQKMSLVEKSDGSNPTKKPKTASTAEEPVNRPTDSNNNLIATTINDDLAQDGGHGDKLAKAMRARVFAQWLLETFGTEHLHGGVLDIAGGKGGLSIELAATGKVSCVVVDPLMRKKHCQNGTSTSGFPVKRDAKRIRKAGGPLPRHLPTFFNQTTFLERYGKRLADTRAGEQMQSEDNYLVDRCSALIGLHPDQTTEDILDIALQYKKSVAIVPCCVFPSFFPMRKLKDGTMVNSHAQFCQYLLDKDSNLKQAVLPFEGRNLVIYRIGC